MKENLMQAKSLITFDLPVDSHYINALFTNTHRQSILNFPYWSLKATRNKIISRYWFRYVLIHFALLYGLAIAVTLPFTSDLNKYFLPPVLIAGSISFFILLLTQYWPRFYSDLLPRLDSLVDEFENRKKEQLQQQWFKELQNQFSNEYDQLARQREELAKEREKLEVRQKELVKCRKEQFPTLTLALIFYVLDKTTGLNSLQCNDHSAALLTKLFGKDPGGIKDNLQLILGKKLELSPRHRTEILNRVSEAYAFFEELKYAEGFRLLQSLELKFKE